jgi:predicted metalloprotease
MRFRPGARLDPGQVQDARGIGGRGIALGGGAGTILVVLVLALLGVNVTPGGGGGPDPLPIGDEGSSGQPTELASSCRTGSDANQREDCRIVGVVNSVQAYWGDRVQGYHEAPTRFFTGQTDTGCGPATSDVGPFYCPRDETVYIDLAFYDELRARFGAPAALALAGASKRSVEALGEWCEDIQVVERQASVTTSERIRQMYMHLGERLGPKLAEVLPELIDSMLRRSSGR